MPTRKLLFSALVVALTMVAGCSSATPTSSAPFVGPVWQWTATTYAAGKVVQVPDPSLYTIQFNADGTYTGKADCNSISGTYTVSGSKLQIKPGAATLAACPPGSLDSEYTTQLYAAADYAMQGSNLAITLNTNAANMVFRSSTAPPVTLVP